MNWRRNYAPPFRRRDSLSRRLRRGSGRFQSAPEHLSDQRLRQLRTKFDACRDLVGGQVLSAERPEFRFGRCMARAYDHPRMHDLALDRIADAGDADFSHRRVSRKHLFDLAGPDLKSARLDHVFLAIDDEYIPVFVEVSEIARVQPSSRAVGVRVVAQYERRVSRTIPIALH